MTGKLPESAVSDTRDDAASPAGKTQADSGPPTASGRERLGVRRKTDGDEEGAPPKVRTSKGGLRTRFQTGNPKPSSRPPASEPRPAEAGKHKAEARKPRKSESDPGQPRRQPSPGATGTGPARRSRADTPIEGRRPRPVADAGAGADAGADAGARAGAAPEGVRLSKIMAERGLCSRREADQIIERGWVFVDGQRVSELGTRIDPAAEITLAPEASRRQAAQVTILLHKPVGYVSGQPEPGYEPAVVLVGGETQFDKDDAQRFHHSHLRGLAPAGRLDIDSTGLLVLTQDGRVARQLIGEGSKVEKEYIVRVQGALDEAGLALLNHGLELDGRKLRPARVEWINEDQLRFVLREGRKRQIRRMCELVGLRVVGLKRTRIGNVKLGDLPLGEWRFLREDERF